LPLAARTALRLQPPPGAGQDVNQSISTSSNVVIE
jgi:hypothetical protein